MPDFDELADQYDNLAKDFNRECEDRRKLKRALLAFAERVENLCKYRDDPGGPCNYNCPPCSLARKMRERAK